MNNDINETLLYRLVTYFEINNNDNNNINTYWLTNPKVPTSNYIHLRSLREDKKSHIDIEIAAFCRIDKSNNNGDGLHYLIAVDLLNSDTKIGFGVYLNLFYEYNKNNNINDNDNRVLPAFYSDNFFILMSNEKKYINITFHKNINNSNNNGNNNNDNNNNNIAFVIRLKGWNVNDKYFFLKCEP